jgi:hypothetical protein
MRHLSLRGNQFTGTLPSFIFEMDELFDLDLRDNNLNGSLPEYGGVSITRMSEFLLPTIALVDPIRRLDENPISRAREPATNSKARFKKVVAFRGSS